MLRLSDKIHKIYATKLWRTQSFQYKLVFFPCLGQFIARTGFHWLPSTVTSGPDRMVSTSNPFHLLRTKAYTGYGSRICSLSPKKKVGQEYSEPSSKKSYVPLPQTRVSDPDSLSPDPDTTFQAEYRSGSRVLKTTNRKKLQLQQKFDVLIKYCNLLVLRPP